MKKLSLLALASMALVGVASAQTKAPAKTKTPAKISCAVMKGDMVGVAEATKEGKFADYKGRRYFFCCPHCISEFKKDPSKFKSAPSIPTPKK